MLKPGGRAALQIITIDDKYFDDYRSRADFIQHYIFPGGMLPSPTRLREETERVGLDFAVDQMFGKALCAHASMSGRKRFDLAWDQIKGGKFDEQFRRLWLYYLAYCSAGFRTGTDRCRAVRADEAGATAQELAAHRNVRLAGLAVFIRIKFRTVSRLAAQDVGATGLEGVSARAVVRAAAVGHVSRCRFRLLHRVEQEERARTHARAQRKIAKRATELAQASSDAQFARAVI